jgi:hypothetical protein
MSKNTTNLSDLPCTCGTLEQYVDGLCPGCIETADRTADRKAAIEASDRAWLDIELALKRDADAIFAGQSCKGACQEEEDVREGDDDRYYSGTGESMDDSSYERYLNRG